MAYGIMRVEKIKLSAGGELYGRAKHNFREFPNRSEMFEPEKTRQNEYIGAQNYNELRKMANERWGKLSGGTRSDAVGMLEVIFTTSAGALSKNQEQDFFQNCLEEVQSWYGAENVLSMQIHRDETTPHCHIFLTPIETVKIRKNRLSEAEKRLPSDSPELFKVKTQLNAKRLLNGRSTLSALQTRCHENIFKKYGLERGEVGSTKKNVRSKISYILEQADKTFERAERTEQKAEKYAEETMEKAEKELSMAQQEREKAKKERSKVLEQVVQDFADIRKLDEVPPKPKFFETKRHYWAHTAVPYYAKAVSQWRLQYNKAKDLRDEKYTLMDQAEEQIRNLQNDLERTSRQNTELKQYDMRKKSSAELQEEAEKRNRSRSSRPKSWDRER